MARGWESKAVEEQQADQLDRRAPKSPLTQEESERESLLLQRKRILLAIENSTNPRYIEQQEKALAFLDKKLKLAGGL